MERLTTDQGANPRTGGCSQTGHWLVMGIIHLMRLNFIRLMNCFLTLTLFVIVVANPLTIRQANS